MADTSKSGRSIIRTRIVYFEGTELPPANGCVCYKIDAPIAADENAAFPARPTIASTNTEFDNMVRGSMVEKPTAASLNFFAGIVKTHKKYKKLKNGVISVNLEIYVPRAYEAFPVLTQANLGLGQIVGPTNGEWWMTGKASIQALDGVAVSLETIDTSGQANGFLSLATFR